MRVSSAWNQSSVLLAPFGLPQVVYRAGLKGVVWGGARLVPGAARPPALAAFAGALQGVEDALRAVQVLAPGIPLLAAHGVHVRHAGLDGAEDAGLLLAQDDAVAHVDAVEAVARVAVDAEAGPGHVCPRRPLA